MKSMSLIYENTRLLDRITQAVDNVRNKVTNTEILEDRIYKRLSRYIKGNPDKAKHINTLTRMTYETIAEVRNGYKNEHYEHYSNFDEVNESDGSKTEFEPVDVLADVESEVVTKEMTTLLAQDGHRDKEILNYWLIGNTNSAHISRSLARTFGGNDSSHRVYVHRFRESCREQLSAAI